MKSRQQGMALIIVLWLIVLLSVMAAGHARNVHTDVTLASRQVEIAKARGLAEAGINHVILEMLADESTLEIPIDGTVFPVGVYDDVVTLAVRNATGLVDLNSAGAELLDDMLRACGVEDADRPALIDSILDWRDRDDLTHLNGIEDKDYFAAGLPWSSRDDAFKTIDELKYLPGVDQGLFERMAPLVTVYSGRSGIDIENAPPILVRMLAGEEIVPATQQGDADSARRRGRQNGTFHIYASVAAGGGTMAAVEAVVTTSRSASQPVRIREWREPPRQVLPPLEGFSR
ncbi:MAG: general secretion pathway protein GspK [Gammaproteobacteria bacterium]|jgi:general secretion pathway protein K|nr:general secretion pathway protein GspK [Gammaproteobacteria bacterium]